METPDSEVFETVDSWQPTNTLEPNSQVMIKAGKMDGITPGSGAMRLIYTPPAYSCRAGTNHCSQRGDSSQLHDSCYWRYFTLWSMRSSFLLPPEETGLHTACVQPSQPHYLFRHSSRLHRCRTVPPVSLSSLTCLFRLTCGLLQILFQVNKLKRKA
ncbi:Hypp5096 [Branchiostoma lanceolatum]|uniref:Hypp5096 protein n=1 Tax=Branchiostoma lanceolatum TaxID=7740 RepID=A0A8K0ACD1_BRALA|nr:Hypp5096 [Branchiostoma lanceolatum]